MTAGTGTFERYVELHARGALARRGEALSAGLARCRLCPRRCGVDRTRSEEGICTTGASLRVASAFPHFGEEACLVGRGGSGTIFVEGCNLMCVYCQNWDTSRGRDGMEVAPEQLAALMLGLAAKGCTNINVVTPSHVVPQLVLALDVAASRGLTLPFVYNTGGYDGLGTLGQLRGVVDVYMPDVKTLDAHRATRWLDASDYPTVVTEALAAMYEQVGPLRIEGGVAVRGVLVRHLVMPGAVDDARAVLDMVARVAPGAGVNVMAQYRPLGEACRHADLSRRPTGDEVATVAAHGRSLGLRLLP